MILTFTPNPSIDKTLQLDSVLTRGAVQRLSGVQTVAGGKGINVAVALAKAQADTVALYPAHPEDLFNKLIRKSQIPAQRVTIRGEVRINTTVTEPDGTTTKLNIQGPQIHEDELQALEKNLLERTARCSWAVLAGSLPPGVPTDWYVHLTKLLNARHPSLRIAIDTSDVPLQKVGESFGNCALSLIKPNGMELGQLVGLDGCVLEKEAAQGNFDPVVSAARKAILQGVENVLVTLGAAGAVLVTKDHAWKATPPPITVLSTVGAGDASLAGFILASEDGLPPEKCLAQAVAYGAAAASFAGTHMPYPHQIDVNHTPVTLLS